VGRPAGRRPRCGSPGRRGWSRSTWSARPRVGGTFRHQPPLIVVGPQTDLPIASSPYPATRSRDNEFGRRWLRARGAPVPVTVPAMLQGAVVPPPPVPHPAIPLHAPSSECLRARRGRGSGDLRGILGAGPWPAERLVQRVCPAGGGPGTAKAPRDPPPPPCRGPSAVRLRGGCGFCPHWSRSAARNPASPRHSWGRQSCGTIAAFPGSSTGRASGCRWRQRPGRKAGWKSGRIQGSLRPGRDTGTLSEAPVRTDGRDVRRAQARHVATRWTTGGPCRD